MASRGVSLLKFVGTVSLGLLTGLSYTLSTLTVPTLLTLPSADNAATAFRQIASSARTQLRTLAGLSSAAFALAFLLSPRQARHPYLLYTSVIVLLSRFGASDTLAPYLYLPASAKPSSSAFSTRANTPTTSSAGSSTAAKKSSSSSAAAQRKMEMSYDVIGGGGSDAASEATDSASDKDVLEEDPVGVNGEEVRDAVEVFLKKQVFSTAAAGVAFAMAIVGIWGDGVVGSFASETFVIA